MATLGRRSNRIGSTATICVALVLSGLFLGAVQSRRAEKSDSIDQTSASAAGPLLRAGAAIRQQGDALHQSLFGAAGLAAENETLRAEIAKLKLESANAESRRALDSLTQAISTNVASGSFDLVPAPVLSGPAPGGRQQLWISLGREQGMETGMVAMAAEGIVGVVSKVYDKTAIVLLVTDAKAKWGAELGSTGELGILQGTGDPHTVMFRFSRTTANAEAGESVVSTGMAGSLAPGGVPFGRVTELSKSKKGEPIAIVELAIEPGLLRTVFILPAVRIPTEPF